MAPRRSGGLLVPEIHDSSSDQDADTPDAADRVGAGWSPSPVPMATPGSPEVPRVTLADLVMPAVPPSLCRLGPCRNYHEARVLLPSHGAIDKSQLIRTCYPHPGIEMDLADTPVLECSRWWPEVGVGLQIERDKSRELVRRGPEGEHYRTAFDAWKEEVAATYAAAVTPVTQDDTTQEGTQE